MCWKHLFSPMASNYGGRYINMHFVCSCGLLYAMCLATIHKIMLWLAIACIYRCKNYLLKCLNGIHFTRCNHPTHGELIDLLEVEGRPDVFCTELCQRYPHIKIGWPSRLLDTVKRLVAPTRASTLGPAKLTGSPLAHYRKRIWEPRIRTAGTGDTINDLCYNNIILAMYIIIIRCSSVPPELADEGLSRLTVDQVRTSDTNCSWKLRGTPTIGFYWHLHNYLKRQPNLSKVLIGRLYTAIDSNFQVKACRPDNTYRFVEIL